jgi:hypothetical protein
MSVDPRVGLELEKLNNSCEKINNLEVNLGKEKICCLLLASHPHLIIFFLFLHLIEDELKRNYLELQRTSQEEIKLISSKIKNAIDLAKPFYEARRQVSELAKEMKADQSNLERSKTNLAAAKEMVFLAEQSVTQVRKFRGFPIAKLNKFFVSERIGRMWTRHCVAGND